MGLADLVKDTSKDHTSVDASGCCLIQIPTDLALPNFLSGTLVLLKIQMSKMSIQNMF